MKKINANAPAKTLYFISSPRSMCHTIRLGPVGIEMSYQISPESINTYSKKLWPNCARGKKSAEEDRRSMPKKNYYYTWGVHCTAMNYGRWGEKFA